MKIRFAGVLVAVVLIPCASGVAQVAKPGKNLLDNGDFAAGIIHWKGDGKAEVFKSDPASAAKPGVPPAPPAAATPAPPRTPMGGGSQSKPGTDIDRSYCVTLGARSQIFSQSFSVPRNAKVLKVTYRARTGEGFLTSRTTLGAFQVRLTPPAGSGISGVMDDKKLERTPEWQTFTLDWTIKAYSRNLDLAVEVFPGTGQLYFDDFVVEALDR